MNDYQLACAHAYHFKSRGCNFLEYSEYLRNDAPDLYSYAVAAWHSV